MNPSSSIVTFSLEGLHVFVVAYLRLCRCIDALRLKAYVMAFGTMPMVREIREISLSNSPREVPPIAWYTVPWWNRFLPPIVCRIPNPPIYTNSLFEIHVKDPHESYYVLFTPAFMRTFVEEEEVQLSSIVKWVTTSRVSPEVSYYDINDRSESVWWIQKYARSFLSEQNPITLRMFLSFLPDTVQKAKVVGESVFHLVRIAGPDIEEESFSEEQVISLGAPAPSD